MGQTRRFKPEYSGTQQEDYRIEDFEHDLAAAASQVPGLVHSGKLAEALGDFVPPDVAARTLRDNAWLEAVAIEIKDMLDSLQRDLTPGRNEPVAGMAASAVDGKHAAGLPAEKRKRVNGDV